jgi:sugar phosphate isomerase/epimerase
MRRYSLAHLTAIKASPPQLVRLAGGAGYDFVGLRLREVVPGDTWPLVSDAALLEETRQALADHDVAVLDVELARLTPDIAVAEFEPMLAAAAALGAQHLLAQGHDDEWNRLVGNFGALADLAATYGLTVDVEFLTWTRMRGLSEVEALLAAAGRPNVGVMIDTLHFCRSGCDPDRIAAIPRAQIHFIQLCDAAAGGPQTVEGLIHTAREDRLYPGDGDLPLLPILARLPRDTVIAIEVPNSRLARELPDAVRVDQALAKAKALVARLDS